MKKKLQFIYRTLQFIARKQKSRQSKILIEEKEKNELLNLTEKKLNE